MIAETRDAATVNAFASHPEIAPHIGGPVDFTAAMRETAVFLFGEHGGFIYEWCAPRTYEAHVMLTGAGRGPWGFAAVRQSVAMMAERGADRLWARVKDRHVALFAMKGGFREVERRVLYAPEPAVWRIMEWRAQCHQS